MEVFVECLVVVEAVQPLEEEDRTLQVASLLNKKCEPLIIRDNISMRALHPPTATGGARIGAVAFTKSIIS